LNRKTVSLVLVPVLLFSIVLGARPVERKTAIANASDTVPEVSFLEEQVVALINGSRAYDYDLDLENIAFKYPAFRSSGSTGANEAANWIKDQFDSFGLETWLEPFEFRTWDLSSKPSLVIDDDGNPSTTSDQTTINSFQCEHYSWPTPESGTFADLVILPLPEAANISEIGKNPINTTEWDAIDTTGKIVLIGREVRWDPSYNWEYTYQAKLRAQPPAAVVYTWWYDWMSFTPNFFSSIGGRPGTYWGPYYWELEIPVGFVNYEDGLWIRNREDTINVSSRVSIRSVIGTGPHCNVVGKISGYKNPEKIIIISAHYDTIMSGGFCDNGAGAAAIIEVAKVFADAINRGFYKPKYTLLFVAFAGEELGLVGSINYIKQHKSEMTNITAVINLDCIGSDELYVTETNPANGFDLDEAILDAAQDLGVNATLEPSGGSDQESFRDPSWANDIYYWYWGLEAGIADATPVNPSAMLDSYPMVYGDKWTMGTPGWIHTSYDNSTSTATLDWVEIDDLENQIKVAALTIVRISPNYGENEATPKYGGTLRMGYNPALAPSTLNPLLYDGNFEIFFPIFSCLLRHDENGSLQPDLAESYEMSESGLDLTFYLYDNVTWHDGVEFNASDVKFTFDTIRDDPNLADSLWRSHYAYGVDSVEVTNVHTVVLHLNETLGGIVQYLAYISIIPKHIYEGTDLATNPANENPVGTGPFKFETWTSGTNLTLTANEEYFRGRPYLDSILYRWDVSGTAMANLTLALENNIVDIVPGNVDPSRIGDLKNTTGTTVATKEPAGYKAIWVNMNNSILQSKKVRQAIAHAINKTKIITEAFCGYASAAKGPLPPSLQEWCNPNISDYEFNMTLAEELLDQEYPRGPDGWRFNLVIKTRYSPSRVPWEANALNIVRDDLCYVGINTTIMFNVPWGYMLSGDFDAYFVGWGFDAIGPDDLYHLFHSGERDNYNRYSNATLDAVLEEGRRSINETLRKIDFDMAQEIVAEDLPQIFLYYPTAAVAYNNDFHGRISNPPISGRWTSYYFEDIWYDPTLSGKGNCPYRVCFTDSEGRRTGYHDGTAYEDIPESTYSGVDSDPQVVKVREPAGIYTVELVGTENSSYKFEFANIALEYKDVWIPEGFIHENETITYIVKVYGDGSIKVYDQDEFSPHDLGMRSISVSKTVVGQDYTADLNATVFNWGDYTEHFNITFYANTTVIGTVIDVVLLSGEPATKSFTWNTSGFAYGNYTISAVADTVPGETDTADNTFVNGALKVAIVGDINGGGHVNILDAILLGNAFDSKPGEPAWSPNADLNGDGSVNILDAIILGNHFDEREP